MNNEQAYRGMTMLLPPLYHEVIPRLHGNEGREVEEIAKTFHSLTENIASIGYEDLAPSTARTYDAESNHAVYATIPNITLLQSHVGRLLRHSCVIGETACRILSDIYFYAEFIDSSKEIDSTIPRDLVGPVLHGTLDFKDSISP